MSLMITLLIMMIMLTIFMLIVLLSYLCVLFTRVLLNKMFRTVNVLVVLSKNKRELCVYEYSLWYMCTHIVIVEF